MAGAISNTYGRIPEIKSIKKVDSLQVTTKKMIDSRLEIRKPPKNQNSEYQKFIKKSKIIISKNEKKLADFKVMLSKINQSGNTTIKKAVSKLEQKNFELKTKLNSFCKNKRQNEWASFKLTFNHDLAELDNNMWNIN